MIEHVMIEIEIVGGPLDGALLKLDEATDWTRGLGSRLSFPWEDDLGEPQVRLLPRPEGWILEPCQAKRRTHLYRRGLELPLPVALRLDDAIRTGNTWLIIRSISGLDHHLLESDQENLSR